LKKFNVGGLFSGVGGIELAFKQAGFNIIWANEIDKNACATYKSIFNDGHLIEGDISEFIRNFKELKFTSNRKIDVLVAGFPCQAFSVAGYRKGFNDERGNVFFRILDVINEHKSVFYEKPNVLFLENVKNFKTHDNGKTYKKVVKELNLIGYSVYTKILNTCEYTNIPQNRERTFMVCFKDEEYWNSENNYSNHDFDKLAKYCPKTFYFHNNFLKKENNLLNLEKLFDNTADSKYFYGKDRYMYKDLVKNIKRKDTVYQWRRIYVRENQSGMCPTLTANMGTGGHNVPLILTKDNKFRKLTPKECFFLQGYPANINLPKNIADSHLYKQVGNSVTVKLIYRLANLIKQTLTNTKKTN